MSGQNTSTAIKPARQSVEFSDLLVAYEREGVVLPLELQHIHDAVKLLKTESGWGRIELVFKSSDLTDTNVTIWQKVAKE